jgi:hypothetical protein
MKNLKQYKVKLDSKEKVEELLQEIYSEACKNIEEAQRLINKIEMSTNLNDEILDGKAKFSKAMNDFISTKDRAIGRKFEIAKLMSEILKYNGNIKNAFTEGEVPGNWGDIVDKLPEVENNNKPVSYNLK